MNVTLPSVQEYRQISREFLHFFFMIDRRLRVLSVLASTGTVTAAAQALEYTPSAVSAQLRTLSEQVGVPLVVPDGRRVQLTAAGRALVSRIDDLYELWEQIEAEVVAASGEVSGSLRMCGFSTAAAALLPPVASRLRAVYPLVAVQIIEAGPTECYELLASERADLAVVTATLASPARSDRRFDQRTLMEDPLDLLLPAAHPLAGQSFISLGDAALEPWIADRDGSPYHQLLLTACAAAGFMPDIRHRAVEWESAAALVDAGLGCALVPRLARLPAGYAIVRVPLSGTPRPSRTLVSVVRRGSAASPVVAAALDLLQEVASSRSLTVG